MIASTTSSVLYSMQSRFIFTRAAAEREREEREDMFYLSIDEGDPEGGSSTSDEHSSSGSSGSSLSSSDSAMSGREWDDDEPDPTWVVDENEEAMKQEWRERQKKQEMLRKRADIKRRLKAERQRRAHALDALNDYHRRTAAGHTSRGDGSASVVGWDRGVEEEDVDHREEELHERKRDSLALGRLRASSLSSEGSGTMHPLGGSGGGGGASLKSSASLRQRKSPSSPSLEGPRLARARAAYGGASSSSASASATTHQPTPPIPLSHLYRSPPLRPSALAHSRTFTHQASLEPDASLATSPRTFGSPVSTISPRPTLDDLSSSTSSSSSSGSSSSSLSPRTKHEGSPEGKARRSRGSGFKPKPGNHRRHSRSLNGPPSDGSAAAISERPRAYSAGSAPSSKDELRRLGKEKKQQQREERKREKRQKKVNERKERAERERKSAGRGSRLMRVLSGGKLRGTAAGGAAAAAAAAEPNRIKRESFTGIDPALLSDSAAQDNPYIEQYRKERNTPRGAMHLQAERGSATTAYAAEHRDVDHTSDDKPVVQPPIRPGSSEAPVRTKPTRASSFSQPEDGSNKVRIQRSNSTSRTDSSSPSSAVLIRQDVLTNGSSGTRPAIPTLSLATVVTAATRADVPTLMLPDHDRDSRGSNDEAGESTQPVGLSRARLGAITPRMMGGFRSIVKKLSKNATDGEDLAQLPQADVRPGDEMQDRSDESLSYSGSDSGSDSSETEEVRQRKRLRKRKLEKKRSDRDVRSRSMSPPRRARNLLTDSWSSSDEKKNSRKPPTSMGVMNRSGRSGSHYERRSGSSSSGSSSRTPRKGGSERKLRETRSASARTLPSGRLQTSSDRLAASSSSSASSTLSPRGQTIVPHKLQKSHDNLQHSGSYSSSSSDDLASSNERVERRGRTMVRRAGDTWGNFLALLSPRVARPGNSSLGSPQMSGNAAATDTVSGKSHASAPSEDHHKAGSRSNSKRVVKRNKEHKKAKKPTRTLSEDRLDWAKDRIRSPSSSSSSSASASLVSPPIRSRSLSPVRQDDQLKHRKVPSGSKKKKKRN